MAKTLTKGILGRFGNILFSLLSGYYEAKNSNHDYKIYNYFCDDHQLDYILRSMVDMKVERLNKKAYPGQGCIHLRIKDDSTIYEPITFSEDKDYIDDRYLQTPKNWNNDINYIKSVIKPDITVINKIKEHYKDIDFSNCVAINIRRGDYKKKENLKLLGLETIEYYLNAIAKCGKEEKYILVSDDVEYCKKYFNYSNFIILDDKIDGVEDYLRDFWIGTICKANIISNSTFSWWMGYLNYNSKNVYYPKPFFNGVSSSSNIIPDSSKWEVVDSKFYSIDSKYKISIVIPCYNINKETFKRTFECIKGQTMGFNDIEIVLVDDNSSDNTYDFLKEYTREYTNVKTATLPENKGQGFARNIGIEIASGEYISFLDADDKYHDNNVLQSIYEKAKVNNADIACGNFKYRGATYNSFSKDEVVSDYKTKQNIFSSLPGLASRIYKRNFLVDNGIRFLSTRVGEDAVFMAENFIKSKRTLLTNICMYDYNTSNGDSTMHHFTFKKLKDELGNKRVFNEMLTKAGVSPVGKTFHINYLLGERRGLLRSLSNEEFSEIEKDLYTILSTEKPYSRYDAFYNAILSKNHDLGYQEIKKL